MKRTFLLAALLLVPALRAARSQEALDLAIRNGTVVDGSGRRAFRADVGVRGGMIVKVGDLGGLPAREVIDAAGLIVAPGFIDVHTHADGIDSTPLAENFVRMGVTTVVAGNCGGSTLQVAEAFRKIREVGISVNFATLVGHNSVRRAVMGGERRAPTAEELARMKELVARAMSEGAVGLSTGLEYVPGAYAATDEIVELARVAAAAGGIYASHLRNEGTAIEQAVEEAIRVGESARCPVQISHIKIDSPSRWGRSRRVLAMIDAARARGVTVQADQYAYTAASSSLSIRFPAWALEGGQQEIGRRLSDSAVWERIKPEMVEMLRGRGFRDLSWAVVASCRADRSLEGLSLKEIALQRRGESSSDAQLETARELMLQGGAGMVYHLMSEDDLRRFMRHPEVSFGSDSGVLALGEGMPHPRGYGNNARVLGYYVRRMKVLRLEEAVRKMTSLAASQFAFADRGLIREGYAADLVLFDRQRIEDRATYTQPHHYPEGIAAVIVNGVPVLRDGRHTGARPGRPLVSRRSGSRPQVPRGTGNLEQ